MRRYAASIEIAAPPPAVWRVLADVAGWAAWDPTADAASGEMVKGGELTLVGALPPQRALRVKVSALDEPRRIEWVSSIPLVLKTVRTYRLSAQGDITRVEISEELSGAMSASVERQLPDLDRVFADSLAALKRRVETGSSWKPATLATARQDWRIDFDRRMREDPDRVLVMVRRFEASPERVYDAWTDPAYASLWLLTGLTDEANGCEIDARPGGRWRITATRRGETCTARGEFLETDRPHRLSLTFAVPHLSPEHDRISVAFEADGDGCIMTFKQEGLAQVAKRPSESGWTPMFRGLAAAIEAPRPVSEFDRTRRP